MRITKEHVTDLYGALGKDDRDTIISTFEEIKQHLTKDKSNSFWDIAPRTQLICMIVTIHAALLVSVKYQQRGKKT
jgi:hypothetical protein